jgi:cation diffusion facilitator family transporter
VGIDGAHHAGALVIAAYARRHARGERFVFGTGKLGDLAAFSSALVLAMIALLIVYESIGRLIRPVPIAFDEAILAAIGLLVNLLIALLLRDDHAHDHSAHHHHGGHHHHYDQHHHADHNLRAAYVHVMADAAVSVLVLVGLSFGRLLGWLWLDPVMGIVGTCVIANWSWNLIRASGAVLLDMRTGDGIASEIADRLEERDDRVSDLHVWRVGPGHCAAVVSPVSDQPEPPESYKSRLVGIPGLSHVTVEVQPCPGDHRAA